ncbi:unnamed protein product [Medioppia subpectinata]|uniref:Uncharacterized protein n=1 Tax=Medioppia subpectinata TaxID=1979941 RepID=A0A7R9L810_9ACAR|nr:unnamed protein product [Medioppia subpectinata]CAG2115929.1 unnamed protein product [Medioppia subpectinata]
MLYCLDWCLLCPNISPELLSRH